MSVTSVTVEWPTREQHVKEVRREQEGLTEGERYSVEESYRQLNESVTPLLHDNRRFQERIEELEQNLKSGTRVFYLAEINRLKLALETATQLKEIVICSAIRLADGRIFRGHRHAHCINLAYDLVTYQKASGYSDLEWECPDGDDQGFISSHNRYVTREEGLALQKAAGIESVAEGGYRGSILFSEDLY